MPFVLDSGTRPVPERVGSVRRGGNVIPESLRAVYAQTAAKALELRGLGLTLAQVVEELNRLGFRTRSGLPYRHMTQVTKLLRSFQAAVA